MNRELAMKVANTVLYEGYMLYPYRPSAIKNRQRWTFGILYPPAYEEVRCGTERSGMHSECLLNVNGDAAVHIQLRFLHLVTREVAELRGERLEPVPSLVIDGRMMQSWEEGVERSVEFAASPLGTGQQTVFSFPGSFEIEPLRDTAGRVVGTLSRAQNDVTGTVCIHADKIRDDLVKLIIEVANETPLPSDAPDRSAALLRSLLSAHIILTVNGGEFASLLDPPEDIREAAGTCNSIGNFPVLVGEPGSRDMLLCSPIILYDYPQIAPESAGDFYDATEMDEMLTLRVMTLTEQEKSEMRLAGEHAHNLLQRTEQSAREQLMRTHGTIRSLRPASDKP